MEKLIDGKLHTRDSIVIQYANLVHKLAHQLAGEYEMEDLANEGFIGLILAFDRFEPDRDLKFMTYARTLIYGQMLKLTRRPASGAHWPHMIVTLAWEIRREELYGVVPSVIAERLDKPLVHVERALLYLRNRNPDRLDASIGADDMEKVTLGDLVGKHDDNSVAVVNDFLQTLSDREKVIIHGLLHDKSQTEIGQMIGVSQNHVSRLKMDLQKKYEEYQRGAI